MCVYTCFCYFSQLVDSVNNQQRGKNNRGKNLNGNMQMEH